MSYEQSCSRIRPASVPGAFDQSLITKTFSKNSIFKVDINYIAKGDVHSVNNIIHNFEDNISKRLRDHEITFNYDFRKLPFLWRLPTYCSTCTDDITKGNPSDMREFEIFQKEYRYMLTDICDLLSVKRIYLRSKRRLKSKRFTPII